MVEKLKEQKNNKIIIEFERLIEQLKFEMDHASTKNESMVNYYRLKQIQNALDIIKKYPKVIKKGEDLKDIKGIGKGTISRINEILDSGRLSEVKIEQKHKQYLDYIEELEQIIGIGRKTAYELVTKYNIKSIEELKKAYESGKIELNNQIITGLKYYNVYQQSIPRSEIDLIYDYLNKKVKEINNELFITICGSYRRLKSTSNDIDVLLTHPKIKTKSQLRNNNNYLLKFVDLLRKDGFLLDSITDKDFEIKYMGFCQLKQNGKKYPIRRIDIRYIPFDSYYSALLYFTGSGEFNKKMRTLAIHLGYLLNEYGLYKINGKRKKKITITSEKDIFDKLGMEYLPPEKRI